MRRSRWKPARSDSRRRPSKPSHVPCHSCVRRARLRSGYPDDRPGVEGDPRPRLPGGTDGDPDDGPRPGSSARARIAEELRVEAERSAERPRKRGGPQRRFARRGRAASRPAHVAGIEIESDRSELPAGDREDRQVGRPRRGPPRSGRKLHGGQKGEITEKGSLRADPPFQADSGVSKARRRGSGRAKDPRRDVELEPGGQPDFRDQRGEEGRIAAAFPVVLDADLRFQEPGRDAVCVRRDGGPLRLDCAGIGFAAARRASERSEEEEGGRGSQRSGVTEREKMSSLPDRIASSVPSRGSLSSSIRAHAASAPSNTVFSIPCTEIPSFFRAAST